VPESLGELRIRAILNLIGERVATPSNLILIGGGALALLGSPRLTVDLDFIGDDISPDDLGKTVMQVAKEQNVYADPVPLQRFIPMPEGSESRMINIGKFGNLTVYAADPYSIALGKPERGLDTDLQDVVFLIQRSLIDLVQLQRVVEETLPRASEFDINAEDLKAHLETIRNRLK
jgi:hypothetical protein